MSVTLVAAAGHISSNSAVSPQTRSPQAKHNLSVHLSLSLSIYIYIYICIYY